MDTLLADLQRRHGWTPAQGVQLVTLDALVLRPFDPGMPLVVLPPGADGGAGTPPEVDTQDAGERAFQPAALPGRAGHGADALALLRRLYPGDHPAMGLGGAPDTTLAEITAAELAAAPHLLPALPDLWNAASPYGLPWLVARLRAPDGCPWDREQDHLSLRPFLLEEAYEVYDALESGSTPDLAEELGDLLLQIVLHAQYGAEAGVFDLADVQRGIMAKIVRRHPHVFGDVVANSSDEVIRNWERIKADERAAAAASGNGAVAPAGAAASGGAPGEGAASAWGAATGPGGTVASAGDAAPAAARVPAASAKAADPSMPAAFAGLSKSLPALAYASEMQGRAAGLGYDWPDLKGVIDKIAEEASELLAATGAASTNEEYGDLLFVIVNMGRKIGVDPEASLRGASRKFASRFARVERLAAERQLELRALGLDALDELWHEAKAEERSEREQREAAGSAATAPVTPAAIKSGRGM